MINSLINQKYFLSKKLQKEIFAIISAKKINTISKGNNPHIGAQMKKLLDYMIGIPLLVLIVAGLIWGTVQTLQPKTYNNIPERQITFSVKTLPATNSLTSHFIF